MYRMILIGFVIFLSSCATTNTWYIVRHAEKESGTVMTATTGRSSDVPLSEGGIKRAGKLKLQLLDKKIKYIYSTNTIRTKSTAQPLSEAIGVPIQFYNTIDTDFLQNLKSAKQNVLVVGHSNTVDDLINALIGKEMMNDLPDSQYGDLFIVHKRGKKMIYETKRFE